MPALPPDIRPKLLTALRTGLSREAACAKLGIRAKDLEATGKRFAEQVAEAEAAGDALIEATLLERGMAGDTQALKMALERRPRLADADLGTGLESLSASERDAVRALVEQAKLKVTVVRITPAGLVEVAPLAPVAAPQSAEQAAGYLDTGQAPVAAPEVPVADWEREPRGRRGAEADAPEAPRVSIEEALAKGPVRDRHNHLVYADLPARSQPGPDRHDAGGRQPVIAPTAFDPRGVH